jgi:GT2 family glycosyltransferase
MEAQVTTTSEPARNRPRVYVIILNWNGWADTLACLESVLALDYDNFGVIVCDNGSTDGSLTEILRWAGEKLGVRDRSPADSRADSRVAGRFEAAASRTPVIVLRNDRNLGFAGGNNVGLQFALQRNDLDYAWLLNNDTVVEPGSLAHLVTRLESTPGSGICGSTLIYLDRRQKVQARGGNYNRWSARVRHVGWLSNAGDVVDEAACEKAMDFVVGASMLVSADFVRAVGLLNEEYFLYFEELDWTLRARGRFNFCYASKSIVYHREGGSTGATGAAKSLTGQYYGTRGRILFTRRFYAYALPSVVMAIATSALLQAATGRPRMAYTTVMAAFDGLRGRTGPRPNPVESKIQGS